MYAYNITKINRPLTNVLSSASRVSNYIGRLVRTCDVSCIMTFNYFETFELDIYSIINFILKKIRSVIKVEVRIDDIVVQFTLLINSIVV